MVILSILPVLGVFRYAHISLALLIPTLILKILSDHSGNPLGFFQGMLLQKLIIRNDDDPVYIIIHVGCIELDFFAAIKVIKRVRMDDCSG